MTIPRIPSSTRTTQYGGLKAGTAKTSYHKGDKDQSISPYACTATMLTHCAIIHGHFTNLQRCKAGNSDTDHPSNKKDAEYKQNLSTI